MAGKSADADAATIKEAVDGAGSSVGVPSARHCGAGAELSGRMPHNTWVSL